MTFFNKCVGIFHKTLLCMSVTEYKTISSQSLVLQPQISGHFRKESTRWIEQIFENCKCLLLSIKCNKTFLVFSRAFSKNCSFSAPVNTWLLLCNSEHMPDHQQPSWGWAWWSSRLPVGSPWMWPGYTAPRYQQIPWWLRDIVTSYHW